jgi:hypothetical protein
MKKIVLIAMFLALIATLAWAVKQISVTSTEITSMRMEIWDSIVTFPTFTGEAVLVVNATIRDSAGDEVTRIVEVFKFVDLPINMRSSMNNIMKWLSKEINNAYADENSETWDDK